MSTPPYDDEPSTLRCTTTLTTPIPPYLPPSILSTRLNWDVFLSFRGVDTRHTMTKSLYEALQSKGLRVFIDGAGMEKGDVIKSSLDEAIADAALAVAIISPKYGDSSWCLDELCGIFESRKQVIPVFYWVPPSDIRWQEGQFGKNFDIMVDDHKQYQETEKEKVKGRENVERWRKALKDVAVIPGYPCRDKSDDPEIIQRVVKQVVGELKNVPEYVAKIRVGLDSRVDQVLEKLDIHSSGVKFLGIHGTPGIGKTTLAKAAFNKLTVHFNRRCFVSNVREQCSNEEGVLSVQNKLLKDLSLGRVMLSKQQSVERLAIKEIVHENRVLVVLDDVSEANQLDNLGIVREWLKEGSRVIITSRDREVINHFCCDNDQLHEAEKLSQSESLELFSIYAFGRREPTEAYLDISRKIVKRTVGLPLALEVLGSSLVKNTMSEWENYLRKLKEIRSDELQGVLKISYDALDAQDKTAFLDISCLLLQMNMEKGDVVDILKGCGLEGELAIGNLVTKSLLKISERNELWMHDQIRDMGKQIVMDENYNDPGKRSRLWDSRDIGKVLRLEKGTEAIRGIVLDIKQPPEMINWYAFRRHPSISTAFNYLFERFKNLTRQKANENNNAILHTKSFEKMKNLKLLQINYSELRGNMKYMPSVLRCLQWRGCSQKTLSENIPEEIRVLDVSGSNIQQLWSRDWPHWIIHLLWPSVLPCWFSHKVARNLVVLNLSNNPHLTALPDMSSNRHLEKLVLKQCVGLTKVHNSIGKMGSLVYLNLQGCSNLVDFSSDITGMKGLKELILSGCSKFGGLPDDVRSLKSLIQLLLDDTAIKDLPGYLFRLTQLEVLSLNRCSHMIQLPPLIGSLSCLKDLSLNHTKLETLPESIGSLSSLEKLSLLHCSSLHTLPNTVENLKSLVEFRLTGTSIQQLPLGQIHDDFVRLSKLEILDLGNNSFHSLPFTLMGLHFLKNLSLRHCENLRSLPRLPSSLELLVCADCYALESICDLSNLHYLQELDLANCYNLADVPGLEFLKSLRRLFMASCTVSASAVKSRLSKVTLRNLNSLFIPGNEIPDWFSQTPVIFTPPPNIVLKDILVAVVVSVDLQNLDEVYAKQPEIVGLQAQILRQNTPLPIISTTLMLSGFPRKVEDHLYLCRYKDYHPLVLLLKGGDTIQIIQEQGTIANGVELKKWGIFLVFENDDDYDRYEDPPLPVEQQSVTRRLASYYQSL